MFTVLIKVSVVTRLHMVISEYRVVEHVWIASATPAWRGSVEYLYQPFAGAYQCHVCMYLSRSTAHTAVDMLINVVS